MLGEDLEEVARAELRCFPGEAWSERDFRDLFRPPVAFGLILEDHRGEMLGYLLAHEILAEAELLNVAVLPDRRGEGLGRMLLEDWHKHLIERGTERSFLEVRVGNRAAIGLYRRMGYQELGLRRRYYADGEDALVMSCTFKA